MTEHNEEVRRLQEEVNTLERENAALRSRIRNDSPIANLNFNPIEFRRALNYYIRICMLVFIPLQLGLFAVWFLGGASLNIPSLGPIPLFDMGGMQSKLIPGIGVGVVSIGGLAVGLIAIGGMAVGVFAMGGCAIGILAYGGGSIGLIAVGGGAVGLISVGGGAAGWLVCAERGAGRYVFSVQRQDQHAVELFTRWLPRFRAAVTQPQPVIRMDSPWVGKRQHSE